MAQPQPSYNREERPAHLENSLQEIKHQIDKTLEMMKKNRNFTPERAELDKLSKRTLELVQKYHPTMSPQQKTLLAAVVDLTEVPVMQPVMQRVAFETALKDASKNIQRFLND